jgi:hypothetical protein
VPPDKLFIPELLDAVVSVAELESKTPEFEMVQLDPSAMLPEVVKVPVDELVIVALEDVNVILPPTEKLPSLTTEATDRAPATANVPVAVLLNELVEEDKVTDEFVATAPELVIKHLELTNKVDKVILLLAPTVKAELELLNVVAPATDKVLPDPAGIVKLLPLLTVSVPLKVRSFDSVNTTAPPIVSEVIETGTSTVGCLEVTVVMVALSPAKDGYPDPPQLFLSLQLLLVVLAPVHV